MFCINRYALVQCLSHEFRFCRSRSRNLQPKLLKQTLHQGISAIRGGVPTYDYALMPEGQCAPPNHSRFQNPQPMMKARLMVLTHIHNTAP